MLPPSQQASYLTSMVSNQQQPYIDLRSHSVPRQRILKATPSENTMRRPSKQEQINAKFESLMRNDWDEKVQKLQLKLKKMRDNIKNRGIEVKAVKFVLPEI